MYLTRRFRLREGLQNDLYEQMEHEQCLSERDLRRLVSRMKQVANNVIARYHGGEHLGAFVVDGRDGEKVLPLGTALSEILTTTHAFLAVYDWLKIQMEISLKTPDSWRQEGSNCIRGIPLTSL